MKNLVSKSKPRWRLFVVVGIAGLIVGGLIWFLWPSPNETETDVAQPASVFDQPLCQVSSPPIECYIEAKYPPDYPSKWHSTPEDCWIIIGKYVYDISRGTTDYELDPAAAADSAIYNLCGADVTSWFEDNNLAEPPIKYIKGEIY